MKPLYLYITRHGETIYNTTYSVQGWNDSSLTELGIFQGRCVGYGLRNIRFDKAYSGDLARQYKTAQIILEENCCGKEVELVIDHRLREMGFGVFEGEPDIKMFGPLFEKINVPFGDYKTFEETLSTTEIARMISENNETVERYEDLCIRVKQIIERIVADNSTGGNVLIATSSFAIDAIINVLFPDYEKRKGLVSNCCICLVRYENDKFYLDRFNDISYRLKGEGHYKKEQ